MTFLFVCVASDFWSNYSPCSDDAYFQDHESERAKYWRESVLPEREREMMLRFR